MSNKINCIKAGCSRDLELRYIEGRKYYYCYRCLRYYKVVSGQLKHIKRFGGLGRLGY